MQCSLPTRSSWTQDMNLRITRKLVSPLCSPHLRLTSTISKYQCCIDLLQLIKTLFDIILECVHVFWPLFARVWFYATRSNGKLERRASMEVLSNHFRARNIFGWFLSIRGQDAEKSISKLLEELDDLYTFTNAGRHKRRFSRFIEHRLGVELLAPRHEKLYFKGTGLTKSPSTRTSETPSTYEQRKRWKSAFETLAANMRCINLSHSSVAIDWRISIGV